MVDASDGFLPRDKLPMNELLRGVVPGFDGVAGRVFRIEGRAGGVSIGWTNGTTDAGLPTKV